MQKINTFKISKLEKLALKTDFENLFWTCFEIPMFWKFFFTWKNLPKNFCANQIHLGKIRNNSNFIAWTACVQNLRMLQIDSVFEQLEIFSKFHSWKNVLRKLVYELSKVQNWSILIWFIKKLELFQSSKLEELASKNLHFCEPIPSKITWNLCNFCKPIGLWNGFWNFERTQTMINIKNFKVSRLERLAWKKFWDFGTNSVSSKLEKFWSEIIKKIQQTYLVYEVT